MPKPTGKENPQMRKLLVALRKQKEGFYKDLARYISKPSRNAISVNVSKLGSDDVVVPGTILGDGSIKKAGNVYALKFSKSAREKIEKAGGKCHSIQKLVEGNKKARIVV